MRLLGLDPGLRRTGWALLTAEGSRLRPLACGVVASDASEDLAQRLAAIWRGVSALIEEWRPDAAAAEIVFANRNPQSTLKLGQARGAALTAAAVAGLAVHEYAATEVKKAVTGTGTATKEQVQAMVARLLPGAGAGIAQADAADAYAVAICCAHDQGSRRQWGAGPALGALAAVTRR